MIKEPQKSAIYNVISFEVEKLYTKYFPDFYGKITFTFEKGKVTVIRKEETIKPRIKQKRAF